MRTAGESSASLFLLNSFSESGVFKLILQISLLLICSTKIIQEFFFLYHPVYSTSPLKNLRAYAIVESYFFVDVSYDLYVCEWSGFLGILVCSLVRVEQFPFLFSFPLGSI